jgi:hypothetical protein
MGGGIVGCLLHGWSGKGGERRQENVIAGE